MGRRARGYARLQRLVSLLPPFPYVLSLDTVVVPVGSSVPVHFLWPGMASEDGIESKDKKTAAAAAEGDPQPLTVDAAMASARGRCRLPVAATPHELIR